MRLSRPISAIGSGAINVLELVGGVGYLLLDTAVALRRGLISGRGRRLGWRNLWPQMVRVGVRSTPFVSIVLSAIGAILVYQIAPILRSYGALDRVADIISVAVFRELGPLVSAIVLTGFAGASIAAEIGSMMVCVAVVGNLMGVAGGMLAASGSLGIGTDQYLRHTFDAVNVDDFVTGLI